MCLSLAGVLVAMLPAQSGSIGELSRAEFLSLLSRMGYTVSDSKDRALARLSDGSTSFTILFGYGSREGSKENHVGVALGRVEFDVSRALEGDHFREWKYRDRAHRMTLRSFLGGRVVLEAGLAYPEYTRDAVKANFEKFFDAVRELKRLLGPFRGKQSDSLYQLGKAPLDLNARLEEVNPEDFDYLRQKLGWGDRATGAVIRGWITGAEPLGVPLLFSGMAGSKPGFFMTRMCRPDAKRLEKLSKDSATIKWAEVTIQEGFVHIQSWVDTSGGMSVRGLRDRVLDFARRVKELDLV